MEESKYELIALIEILEELKIEEPYNLGKIKNNHEKQNYINELTSFYKKNDRHFYSDISLYSYNCTDEDLDYLIKNIEILLDYYLEGNRDKSDDFENDINLLNNLKKLMDHIKLEIHRRAEVEKKIKSESIRTLNTQMSKVTKLLEDGIDERINSVDKKIEKMNIESITVLSIFSAIIMTLFGGFSFYGQALENINKSTLPAIYKVVIIISLAMINIFYILFI